MSANPCYQLGTFRLALRLAKTLPRPVSQFIAALIGRIAFAVMRRARGITRRNLSLTTKLQGRKLDALCRKNFSNFLKMLADYFYCTAANPQRIDALLGEWRGFENLVAAREQGNGVLLVTAHLGNWELGGMLLALRDIPMTVLTLPEPSDELSRWRENYRKRLGIRTVTVGSDPFSFLEIINALKRNEVVAMLVDRPHNGSGSPVDFFNHATEFSTAPALLHHLVGVSVLPAFVLQNPDGRYLSFIEPPVPLEKGANRAKELAANTQKIAGTFEEIIRQHPEQWYNYVSIWHEN